MKHVTIVALFSLLVRTSSALAQDQCFTCHRTSGDTPSALFQKDIHHKKGIPCAGCHGGDPRSDDMEKAMDKAAGFIGVPKGDEVSKMCASCHSNAERMKQYGSSLPTNQWEKLQESVHGRLSLDGKQHIAQCTTCHTAHGIASVKDPASPVYPLSVVKTCSRCHSDPAFMREYNPSLPVDQLEKYRTSVHGMLNAKGDAKTAECASCHGSHEIRSAKDLKSRVYAVNLPSTCAGCHSNADYMKGYRIPTDQFEKYARSVHGVLLLEKKDVGAPACNSCHGNHGAAPPGIESVSQVCGSCHALNADLFSSSPHKKAFDAKKLPECETCHSNHEILAATDTMLGVAPGASCSRCHSERENPAGYAAAKGMRSLMDSLGHVEDLASALVNDAEQKGMEISEAKFKLRDVRQARLEARTMVHAFSQRRLTEVVQKGTSVAEGVITEGKQAIEEYYFRRWGLGIATLIITTLAIALYVAIKRIERRNAPKG